MPSPNSSSETRNCPQCGAKLPLGVPPEFCPRCLLSVAMAKTEAGENPPPLPSAGNPKLSMETGQLFGHYRIVRPIGSGGMGTVFDAEDLENSRRVALKVLSHRLDSPEARERFFREGRLAASINHPNSVYIFGTEEVAGTPVIAMELLAGGTLLDRIRLRGPMPPGEAVDAILQIIEGLEAAQKSGILHRDIKPSNCFLDPDGTVKIGDFGLSISTAVRTEPALTSDGAFLGTPAFCPPEQLRGEELNMRSDIYSVGATLFYLLTGRTPFEAPNVVALIATVLEKPSPSPSAVRPDIPQDLAKAVQRCLHKQRGERFANYLELRQAIEPYSSVAPVPAPLGTRFLAGLLDFVILSVAVQILILLFMGGLVNFIDFMSARSGKGLLVVGSSFLLMALYYALPEGLMGATAGKAICGLRVAGPNRNLPGLGRALIRALFYVLLPVLPFWIVSGALYRGDFRDFFPGAFFPGTNTVGFYFLSVTPYVVIALLFSTARRRNGLRAIHDFASRTQVIVRKVALIRAQPMPEPGLSASTATHACIGPYQVMETISEEPGCRWLLGYDLRLLRKVWIRQLPPGAEPFPLRLRNIGRPGRLRWLTGRRLPGESWDAFEAPGGQAFADIVNQPQSWQTVRFWLWDLAQELSAAKRDHTEPEILSLSRVWITAEGKPKILDFPVPEVEASQVVDTRSAPPDPTNTREFLARIATAALNGDPKAQSEAVEVPIPVYAGQFISELRTIPEPDGVLARLRPILGKVTVVTRLRRAMVVLGCVAFPLFTLGSVMLGMGFLQELQKRYPDVLNLHQLLSQRQGLKFAPHSARFSDSDFAVYVASHHASFITNKASWNSPMAMALISGSSRKFAETAVLEHRTVTPEEFARAQKNLAPLLQGMPDLRKEFRKPGVVLMILHVGLIIYVGIPALICALAFRTGPVLLLTRVTFVRRDGLPASRLRVFWRALVAWSPVALGLFAAVADLDSRKHSIGVLGLLLVLTLTAISLALPTRGLQDRLAGTWPVPK